jgi:hypothetical protein
VIITLSEGRRRDEKTTEFKWLKRDEYNKMDLELAAYNPCVRVSCRNYI